MKVQVAILVALLAMSSAFSGESDPPKNGNEMSLELYQKLKSHFDSLYGASVALLPGVEPTDRGETERALKSDSAAHKAELIKALGSSQVIHREIAARALEYCGDKKAAVEALVKVVNDDKEDSVRRAAAGALAKLPDASAVDSLIKGLSDSADSVRGTCATALGNVKDPRATQPLLDILKSELKPLIRMQAATALAKIKDPASKEGLEKLLESEKDERVKMAIAGAIRGVMGGNSAQTEPVPSAAEASNELANLAKEMKEVEQKLRDDRHDQAVQVQGNQIEQKLAMLIEKLDKG